MEKAYCKTHQITVLFEKYVVGGFICVLGIMAILNVIYSRLVYGEINEEVLYFPYHFV